MRRPIVQTDDFTDFNETLQWNIKELPRSHWTRRHLKAWLWNPTLGKRETVMILEPSPWASSPVVVTAIHKVINVFEKKNEEINIDTIVSMHCSVMFYDHAKHDVVKIQSIHLPSVLGCRLYQTPAHGPPIDEAWLKVPFFERVQSGFYGNVEWNMSNQKLTSNRVDTKKQSVQERQLKCTF